MSTRNMEIQEEEFSEEELSDGEVQKGMDKEELLEWVQDMKEGLARIVTFKSTADELKTWGERLEALGPSIFEVKGGSKSVKWSLVAHLHSKEDSGDVRSVASETETSYSLHLNPHIHWFSVPKLKLIPWKEAEKPRNIQRIHYAMEIPLPLSEWTPTDNENELTKPLSHSAKGGHGAAAITPKTNDSQTMLNELPERLLLNSLRLRRFIDYEYCDGALPWIAEGPFVILRPFKLFIYLQGKIRARIRDFEQARTLFWQATEEEYVEHYQKNPCEDAAVRGHQRESQMNLAQLTGWILDFRCLEKFMDEYLEPQRIRLANTPDTARFSDLWYLFPVGSLIFVRDSNTPQKIWKVIQRTGGRKYLSNPAEKPLGDYQNSFSDFVLDCYHLDYDGAQYVPTFSQFKIGSYDGVQATKTLPVMPLRAAEREKLIDRNELLDRGQQFKESTKVCHRYYSGRSRDRTPKGGRLSDLDIGALKNVSRYSERIDSEVMVDFERALQELPSWRPGDTECHPHMMEKSERGNSSNDPDEKWDRRFTNDFMESETRKWKGWEKRGDEPKEEDDVLLLPDRVFAFVLRTRSWACLQIGKDLNGKEQLTKLEPQPEPWNNLELPQGHKEIVQSLIDSHFSKDKSRHMHFDLIRNKGKGVIILLHGVPGVGKTSTAECAAESNGRPLLPITCGDLGLTPTDVEAKLQQVFRLAQAWDCVMLLDEADIFLAQRTATDTERNALVSVFLRTLEYYEGILFLTTNRVGVFDEAFKSRIHISLYYPPLKQEQTIKIWRAHIEKAIQDTRIEVDAIDLILGANEIFERQLDPQFGPVWNGRQIRNAFQSAVALAGFHTKAGEAIKLERKYFKQVFEVSDQFSNYVWMVKQRNSDAQWNMMNMVRRDDWTYPTAPADGTSQVVPVNQWGQTGQAPRFGAFPQSTFGQSMPRPTTPFGGMGSQVPGNPYGQMFGMQMGQNQWPTNVQGPTTSFGQSQGNQGSLHPQHQGSMHPQHQSSLYPQYQGSLHSQDQGQQSNPAQASPGRFTQQSNAGMQQPMNFTDMGQQAASAPIGQHMNQGIPQGTPQGVPRGSTTF